MTTRAETGSRGVLGRHLSQLVARKRLCYTAFTILNQSLEMPNAGGLRGVKCAGIRETLACPMEEEAYGRIRV